MKLACSLSVRSEPRALDAMASTRTTAARSVTPASADRDPTNHSRRVSPSVGRGTLLWDVWQRKAGAGRDEGATNLPSTRLSTLDIATFTPPRPELTKSHDTETHAHRSGS